MMTAKEIRAKEFEKVKFGYQAEEVNAFLRKIEADYRQMEDELAEANNKMMLLADKVREYKEGEEDLKNALLSAQKQARQIVDEAKEKAAQITDDAKSSATSVHSAAVVEQETQLKELSAKLDKENRILVETQRQVASFKKSLFDMYRQHLEQISNLPDTIDEDCDDEEDDVDEAEVTAAEEAPAEEKQPEAVTEEAPAAEPVQEEKKEEAPKEEAPAPTEPAKDPFDEVEFSTPKKPISRTAEFDTRYKDLKNGNRREEKRKRF